MPIHGITNDSFERGEMGLKEFILRCARCTIGRLRDEPDDAAIPDRFEPKEYHLNALKEAKRKLARIKRWTAKKAKEEERRSYKKALDQYKKDCRGKNDLKKSYLAMIAKVEKWIPPTEEHKDFKAFVTR